MLRCEVEMTERQKRISSCKQGMPQLSWAISSNVITKW